ncbi:hypothetical protein IWX76_000070 [Pedobacter sp. CAN_A7]|uniref:hypothetical protein n=1 Tax=Pedobacter sp. CAN_A7 TaxID=2787722 RepID=UPI0018CA96A0
MGGRPEKPHKPLLGYIPNYIESGPRSIDLIRIVVNKANAKRLWIFEPKVKRWWTPEEFMSQYERFENLDPKWIENLQVRDPLEGIEAADVQIKSILDRKAILIQKIVDYWKGKKC